jgi:hypothetical protein
MCDILRSFSTGPQAVWRGRWVMMSTHRLMKGRLMCRCVTDHNVVETPPSGSHVGWRMDDDTVWSRWCAMSPFPFASFLRIETLIWSGGRRSQELGWSPEMQHQWSSDSGVEKPWSWPVPATSDSLANLVLSATFSTCSKCRLDSPPCYVGRGSVLLMRLNTVSRHTFLKYQWIECWFIRCGWLLASIWLNLDLALSNPLLSRIPLLGNCLRLYTHSDSDPHSNLTGFMTLLGVVLVLIKYKWYMNE